MLLPRTHLQSVLLRCRPAFAAVLVVSFGVNLLILTGSIYMLQVYDRVLTSRSGATLFFLTVLAVGALLVMAALDIVRSRILVRIGVWIDRILSPLVLARVVNASKRTDDGVEPLRDVATLRNFLGGGAVVSLMDAPWTPLYLGFIYLLHPYLGHVALIGAVFLFALALLAHALTRRPLQHAGAESADAYRSASAAVRNADAVSAMGMIGSIARRWDARNAYALHLQQQASDRNGALAAIAKFVRMCLQIAILAAGAALVMDDAVGPGVMVAASIIVGRAVAPVEQAISVWKQVVGARDAWVRLERCFRESGATGMHMRLPAPEGRLFVENVTYRPPAAREPTLANVSFVLEPGEALAIVGPSGAGKSTLAQLILGVREPLAGVIRLDGVDISTAGAGQFGPHIGFMPQNVELFPGSIGANIARMDEQANPAEIVEAAKMAGVHDLILRLPNGYDTRVSGTGAPLSGGQLQRVGLARALFGKPRLIVLDEPNASLDTQGEDALNEAIRCAREGGATIVCIAHRPSMMKHMDKALVLKDGRVQLFGDRETVLGKIHRPASEPPKRVRIVS